MNPLILGILALGGFMVFSQMQGRAKQDRGDDWGLEAMEPGTASGYKFIVSGESSPVPYAGFRGGGVSGTVSEEYLPPLGGLGGRY